MSKFILSSDSCCDEFKTDLVERNIECLPMNFCIDEFLPDDFDCDEQYRNFYTQLRNGKISKTSQPNLTECVEYFSMLVQKYPAKDILHLALSSGLSGAFETSTMAAKKVMEKNPDSKIIVFDTLTATQGQSYLLLQAECCRINNKSIEETRDFLVNIRDRLHHFIVPHDLLHLYRGGRLNKSAAVVGTMLQIKPIVVFNDIGKLVVFDKVKGLTKSIKYLVKSLAKYGKDILGQPLFIAHCDAPDLVDMLKGMILEEYPEAHIKIGWIGPVVGSHTGPGTVAIVFAGDPRPTIR